MENLLSNYQFPIFQISKKISNLKIFLNHPNLSKSPILPNFLNLSNCHFFPNLKFPPIFPNLFPNFQFFFKFLIFSKYQIFSKFSIFSNFHFFSKFPIFPQISKYFLNISKFPLFFPNFQKNVQISLMRKECAH